MKNFVQHGDTLTVPAPADVLSGAVVISGSLIGIAEHDALSGADVAVKTSGVFELAKVSAQAWTLGAKIYWAAGAGNATTTATDNTLIGIAVAAAANPSATGLVKIGPTVL